MDREELKRAREKIRGRQVVVEVMMVEIQAHVEEFHLEKHQEQEDQHKANHAPPEPLLASERALRKIE